MELDLQKESFDAYELGGEVVLTQEETTETIVPDYCPDMARIIETEGTIYLHSREIRNGRAEVTGAIQLTVLYVPDDEVGVRTLEYSIPFTVESDQRGLAACSCLLADVDMELLETRMLNPRKLFTHAKLVSRLSGYQRAPFTYCTDAVAEKNCCLEKKQEVQHGVFLTHILEHEFTCTEDISLPQGRDSAEELLTSRVSGTVTEARIVGSKLMIKGIFQVQLLYRTETGRCCAFCGELPFSQVMEGEGTPESAVAAVQLIINGCDLQLEESGREVSVTIYCQTSAQIREERELKLLSDLYSTAYETDYEAEPLTLTAFRETLDRRQNVREVLEIGAVAGALMAVTVNCGPVSSCREGKLVTLRTGALVRVIYLDEGGTPLTAERCVDVSIQLELPEECRVAASAACPEEAQGTVIGQGIDVRFPILFHIEAETVSQRICIARAGVDRERPKDSTGAPSLVLRCLRQQEHLWDIAKAYSSNIPTILGANQLDSEADVQPEQLLLIPRMRG